MSEPRDPRESGEFVLSQEDAERFWRADLLEFLAYRNGKRGGEVD